MPLLSYPTSAFYFACFTLTAIAAATPKLAVKVGGAESPGGKYTLAARMESDASCRVEVRAAGHDKPLAHFSISDYYAEDLHYSIYALWKDDATAFALNFDQGLHFTSCRIFTNTPDGWTELSLPAKSIEKIRKAGNENERKLPASEHLYVAEWLPKDNVKLYYFGDSDEWDVVFHLVRKGKPHLELVNILEANPEPPPNYDPAPRTARIIAGHGKGSADGPANRAQFTNPAGIAADATGNIYVADTGNATLRRIKPDGTVETVAGAARQLALVDGTGKDARFSNPRALAVGPDGNIYVAESLSEGSLLRKVTPQGVVTTVAKDLGDLTGLAVDRAGVIYVTDFHACIIRKIDRDGTVTLLAGQPGKSETVDGPAKDARFDRLGSIAVAPDGSLYVVGGDVIRKIDAQGVVTTLAGTPYAFAQADGKGNAAKFEMITSIAIDSQGTLYVTELEKTSIRQISSSGVVRTLQPTTRQRLPLKDPVALAIDPQGRILVADGRANTVVLVELAH